MYSLLRSGTFSICHKLISPQKLILKRFSVLEKIKGKPILLDKTNHKVIYEFKYIIFTAGILKSKYLLPIISAPLILASFYFSQPQLGTLIVTASFLQIILLTVFTKLASHMIGKIYVNKIGEVNNVIISSVDSKGNRIDESFHLDQIFLSKSYLIGLLGFTIVETNSGNKKYLMNIKSGKFHDMGALKLIFNDILCFGIIKSKNKNK